MTLFVDRLTNTLPFTNIGAGMVISESGKVSLVVFGYSLKDTSAREIINKILKQLQVNKPNELVIVPTGGTIYNCRTEEKIYPLNINMGWPIMRALTNLVKLDNKKNFRTEIKPSSDLESSKTKSETTPKGPKGRQGNRMVLTRDGRRITLPKPK